MYLTFVPLAFDRSSGLPWKAWRVSLEECRSWTLFLPMSLPALAEACRCFRIALGFAVLGELYLVADVGAGRPE